MRKRIKSKNNKVQKLINENNKLTIEIEKLKTQTSEINPSLLSNWRKIRGARTKDNRNHKTDNVWDPK